ncbi:MAG: anthranilate phosphoribosyltransferase [Gemmatimonadales bacterium]
MATEPPTNRPAPTAALRHALSRLELGHDLTEAETESAVADIIAGGAPQDDVRSFLMRLREKGEAASEVAGAVRALRGAMRRVRHADPASLVDTCGTGGGRVTTINVSTAAAFVAAGGGVAIAKHGNRSHTSRSGSADVLEAAGVGIDLDPERAAQVLEAIGLVFLFAPSYHPAMRHVAAVRRELGVPTLMNLVGPLANPAGVSRQVIGVADLARGPVIAEALVRI